MSALNSPVEEDLCSSFVVLLHELLDSGMFHNIWASTCVCTSSDWAISNRLDTMLFHEFDQLQLSIERVELDLIDNWFYSRIRKHVPEHLDVEVRHSNALHKALIYESFHLSPNLIHGQIDSLIGWLISLFLRLDNFNRDRPVDQIKV